MPSGTGSGEANCTQIGVIWRLLDGFPPRRISANRLRGRAEGRETAMRGSKSISHPLAAYDFQVAGILHSGSLRNQPNDT